MTVYPVDPAPHDPSVPVRDGSIGGATGAGGAHAPGRIGIPGGGIIGTDCCGTGAEEGIGVVGPPDQRKRESGT